MDATRILELVENPKSRTSKYRAILENQENLIKLGECLRGVVGFHLGRLKYSLSSPGGGWMGYLPRLPHAGHQILVGFGSRWTNHRLTVGSYGARISENSELFRRWIRAKDTINPRPRVSVERRYIYSRPSMDQKTGWRWFMNPESSRSIPKFGGSHRESRHLHDVFVEKELHAKREDSAGKLDSTRARPRFFV